MPEIPAPSRSALTRAENIIEKGLFGIDCTLIHNARIDARGDRRRKRSFAVLSKRILFFKGRYNS